MAIRYHIDKPIVLAEEYASKRITPNMRQALREIRKEAARKETMIRNSQAAPSTGERHYPKEFKAGWKE